MRTQISAPERTKSIVIILYERKRATQNNYWGTDVDDAWWLELTGPSSTLHFFALRAERKKNNNFFRSAS